MASAGDEIQSQTQDTPWDLTCSNDEDEKPKPWGRAISSNPKYATVDLFDSEVIFGRRGTCTVKIDHPAVSGQHCSLIIDEQKLVFVKDLSTNGTFVDGRKIGKGNQLLLNNGSEIVLIRTAQEKISYQIYLPEEKSTSVNGPEVDYDIRETLGYGAFATVKMCVHRRTGQKYAIKVIDKKKFAKQHHSHRPNALQDEVKILQRLAHRNVIKIFDVFETEDTLYLVLELVTGGDLFDAIVALKGKGYPEDKARNLFSQMLQAIAYLHRHNVVHRDLKPENILLTSKTDDTIKLTDFGLSRIVGEGSFMQTLCGTPQYLAPEVLGKHAAASSGLNSEGYDKSVDLWSLGVILYVLLSGAQPFPNSEDGRNVMAFVMEAKYSFPSKQWSGVSPSAVDLVKRLMCKDPQHRINIEQAMEHPWMKGESTIPDPVATPGRKRKVESPSPSAQESKKQFLNVPQGNNGPKTPVLPPSSLRFDSDEEGERKSPFYDVDSSAGLNGEEDLNQVRAMSEDDLPRKRARTGMNSATPQKATPKGKAKTPARTGRVTRSQQRTGSYPEAEMEPV